MKWTTTARSRVLVIGAVVSAAWFAGWGWAQQPAELAPIAEAAARQELVDRLESQFERVGALHRRGAAGGETEQLALVRSRLLLAKAGLVSAKGHREQQQALLAEAREAARDNVDACEAAAAVDRLPLERLLDSYQLAAEADLQAAAAAESRHDRK